MQKEIIIMRHAKSDRSAAGIPDHERPLNQRGEKASLMMGKRIKKELFVPQLIICSDALRARETAENAAAELGYDGKIRLAPELYLCEPDAFFEVMRGLDEALTRIMIVAHNPGVEDFGRTYLGWEEARLPTAAYLCFSYEGVWSEIAHGALRLCRFDFPKSR